MKDLFEELISDEEAHLHLFQRVRDHVARMGNSYLVTPLGWQPGKPILKPGPGLAGKVWKAWKPDMAF